MIVPTFDWTTFLAIFFCKVRNVKKCHHFHFAKGSSNMRVQEFADSGFLEQSLVKRKSRTMPQIIVLKRQWYLYEEICPFTAECCQDTTTPLPAVAKPRQKPAETVLSDSDDDIPPQLPKSTQGRGQSRKTAQ